MLCSHFLQSWKDLPQYQFLILCTHCPFTGQVWVADGLALREHSAATNLTWSAINVQLFNFHTAGASMRSPRDVPISNQHGPRGATSSQMICKSWNRGHCFASQMFQLPWQTLLSSLPSQYLKPSWVSLKTGG